MSEVVKQRIADLTTDELEMLVKRWVKEVVDEELEAVYDYLFAIEDQMPDPDAGKRLKPEIEAYLRKQATIPDAEKVRISAAEVNRKLGTPG